MSPPEARHSIPAPQAKPSSLQDLATQPFGEAPALPGAQTLVGPQSRPSVHGMISHRPSTLQRIPFPQDVAVQPDAQTKLGCPVQLH
jgi:hypothetical protein